jgi:hypothetical protein
VKSLAFHQLSRLVLGTSLVDQPMDLWWHIVNMQAGIWMDASTEMTSASKQR